MPGLEAAQQLLARAKMHASPHATGSDQLAAAPDPDDVLRDWEIQHERQIRRAEAAVRGDRNFRRFTLKDCEVTLIPDGDDVRCITSLQTEMRLTREEANALDTNGWSCVHACLCSLPPAGPKIGA